MLFLAVSGGLIWWHQHKIEQQLAQVEKLAEVYKDIGAGKTAQAPRQLDELSDSGGKAVSASALFARAALALQQNDVKRATAIYKSIAEDGDSPEPYRHVALVRQTALEFDSLKPDEVIGRLAPLTKPGEPWFGSAGEMTALAMMKQGKRQEAGQLYAAIAKDPAVPTTIRARAVQVAGSLGIDASSALAPQAQ